MPEYHSSLRRKFLQKLGSTTFMLSAASLSSFAAQKALEEKILRYEKKISTYLAPRMRPVPGSE